MFDAVAKHAERGSAKENEPGSIICDTVLFDSACSYRNRGREEATES